MLHNHYTTRSTLVTWWVMKNGIKNLLIKIHTVVCKETLITNKQVHRFKILLRFKNIFFCCCWETMFWLSCQFDYSSVWSCYHMQWSLWMSRGWFLQMLWWILRRFLFKYIYIIWAGFGPVWQFRVHEFHKLRGIKLRLIQRAKDYFKL